MFAKLATFALLAVPAFAAFSIDTPVFTQCKSVDLAWSGGQGPYNLIIVNSADPCGEPVADLGDHDGTKLNWKVALPAGKTYELSLEDASGDEAWSGAITVAKSDDDSCVPASLKSVVSGSSNASSAASGEKPAASAAGGSTVVFTPTVTQISGPQETSVSSSSNGLSGAVGGVGNAGSNPLGVGNGALTMRQASTPVMVLGAFAAILVASL